MSTMGSGWKTGSRHNGHSLLLLNHDETHLAWNLPSYISLLGIRGVPDSFEDSHMQALLQHHRHFPDLEPRQADLTIDASNADDAQLELDFALLVHSSSIENDGRERESVDLVLGGGSGYDWAEEIVDGEKVLVTRCHQPAIHRLEEAGERQPTS